MTQQQSTADPCHDVAQAASVEDARKKLECRFTSCARVFSPLSATAGNGAWFVMARPDAEPNPAQPEGENHAPAGPSTSAAPSTSETAASSGGQWQWDADWRWNSWRWPGWYQSPWPRTEWRSYATTQGSWRHRREQRLPHLRAGVARRAAQHPRPAIPPLPSPGAD